MRHFVLRITASICIVLTASDEGLCVNSVGAVESAETVWTRAKAARGIARVDISNVLLVEKFGRRQRTTSVELIVLPNLLWYWTGELSPHVPQYVSAYDFQTSRSCLLQPGQETPQVHHGADTNTFRFLVLKLLHLMETPDMKLKLLGYRAERLRSEDVAVVTVEAAGEIAEFWIGARDHLAKRISFPKRGLPVLDIKEYYLSKEGVVFPLRTAEDWLGKVWTFHYEHKVNVTFDERVRDCGTGVSPEAWRRRTTE